MVEPALARALVLAAEAQRWDVVAQIAMELQARRESGACDQRPPPALVAVLGNAASAAVGIDGCAP